MNHNLSNSAKAAAEKAGANLTTMLDDIVELKAWHQAFPGKTPEEVKRDVENIGNSNFIAEMERLRADKERIDWLESQGGRSRCWVARESTTGRGFRLHTDYGNSWANSKPTVREAIDIARAALNPKDK